MEPGLGGIWCQNTRVEFLRWQTGPPWYPAPRILDTLAANLRSCVSESMEVDLRSSISLTNIGRDLVTYKHYTWLNNIHLLVQLSVSLKVASGLLTAMVSKRKRMTTAFLVMSGLIRRESKGPLCPPESIAIASVTAQPVLSGPLWSFESEKWTFWILEMLHRAVGCSSAC